MKLMGITAKEEIRLLAVRKMASFIHENSVVCKRSFTTLT